MALPGSTLNRRLDEAVSLVRDRIDAAPEIALILGSGLGDLADAAEGAEIIPTSGIPHYPRSTVSGHSGRLVFGRLEGRQVVFVQGRAHLYEGHSMDAVAFPVRLVHALGARRLLVTNAAGGIHPGLKPGTLMLIHDHLNMVDGNPLGAWAAPGGSDAPRTAGAAGGEAQNDSAARRVTAAASVTSPRRGAFAERTPRDRHPYDEAWLDAAERIALDLGIRTQRGVYLWTRGPSYETKAEISAYRRLGADAVGMSTVPEVLQAAAGGMKVLGISSITNPAAGLSQDPLDHDDVLEVGRQVRGDLERLVRGILSDLP